MLHSMFDHFSESRVGCSLFFWQTIFFRFYLSGGAYLPLQGDWEQISERRGGNRKVQTSFCINPVTGL